jgi:2'-5' RNA ligase
VRLFIAVWPPEEVIDLLSRLPRSDVSSIRWTTKEQWHSTLAFLGEVPDADGACAALAILGGSGVAEAVLGPSVAWFRGNRVLQVPVSGLEDLSARAERAIAKGAAFTKNTMPSNSSFKGHLTVARVRGRRPIDRPLAAQLAGGAIEARWDVTQVSLVRSELHPDGSRYSNLFTVDL